MASTNRRDVQLVISAKEQATKAFDAAAAALQNLLSINNKVGDSATKTGDRLGDLAAMAATLDKAYAAISGSADKAEQAFGRQVAKLDENRTALAALKAQADIAAAAIERLSTSKIQGPPTQRQAAELVGLTAEYERLQTQQSKLQSTIASLESSLDTQRSTLQQIGSTTIAAADAQGRLRSEIEQETAASNKRNAEIAVEVQRREQAAAAAQRMSAIQQQINQLTGVDRQSAGAASASAEVLAEVAAHDALIQKLKQEEVEQRQLAELKEAQARSANLLPGNAVTGKSAQQSAAVFQQADIEAADKMQAELHATTVAEKEMDAAAQKLRATLDPLAAVEAELNTNLAATNKLYAAGKISANELAQATTLLKKNAAQAQQALAAKGKPTLFGLTPYNVQNLSFQINDIFTQLASGTSITQTLAQQGGQILQIFPKVGSAIIAAFTNPYVIAFAATLGTVVLALKKLNDEAEQLKHFNTELSATAEGGVYTGQAMQEAAKQLQEFGVSADDATKSIDNLMKGGVNPEMFVAFGKAAKAAALVLGKEVPDAAKEQADAFTHGYDAVKKLDDQYDFLTASERNLIRQMFEEGNAAQARTAAFNIWNAKMEESARNAEGPWSRAWRNLTNSFNAFLGMIAHSAPIQFLNDLLKKTGQAVEYVTSLLPGSGAGGPNGNGRVELPQGSLGSGGIQRGAVALSEDDIVAIVKTAVKEAAAGNAQGQQDVASVVINRMIRSGQSAMGVVGAPFQFEGVGNEGTAQRASFYAMSTASKEFQEALKNILPVLQGLDTTNGAVNFYAPKAQAALGRKAPGFASQGTMTADRAGQQFFTGTFPGDKGLTAGTDTAANSEARKKIGDDIIAGLQKQLQVTEDLTDAEKVRQAGLKAVAKAENDGVVDPKQLQTIRELAEADAQRKVDLEKQAKARALEGQLANDNLATQKAGAQSLQQILDAIDRKAASTKAKIDQAQKEGVTSVGGQSLDVLRAQVDANTEIAKQQATQKFYSDQLAALDKQRADAAQDIANKVKAGTLSPAQGAEQLAQKTAELKPQYDALVAQAQKFKDTLGSANITPELKAFFDKISTGGGDAIAGNAKASLELLQQQFQQLNAAISERNELVQTNNALQQQGAITAADLEAKNKAAYEGAAPAIQQQIAALQQLLDVLRQQGAITDQVYSAWVAKLQLVQTQTEYVNKSANQIANTIGNDFVNGAANAFDQFAQSVAQGKDVMDSLKNAFLQFASDFLRQIAQMIIKQALFNALGMSQGGGGSPGGLLGSIGGIIGGLFHDGGVVGQSGGIRAVQPEWFANARRYHTGGIAGLAPNEVPAVLQRGEEVLTADDPRHINNGSAAAAAPSIKNVVVFDPADVLSKGLASKVGEKVILNFIRDNAGAVKGALG